MCGGRGKVKDIPPFSRCFFKVILVTNRVKANTEPLMLMMVFIDLSQKQAEHGHCVERDGNSGHSLSRGPVRMLCSVSPFGRISSSVCLLPCWALTSMQDCFAA